MKQQNFSEFQSTRSGTIAERYSLMLESRKKIAAELHRQEVRLKFLDRKIEHYGNFLNAKLSITEIS